MSLWELKEGHDLTQMFQSSSPLFVLDLDLSSHRCASRCGGWGVRLAARSRTRTKWRLQLLWALLSPRHRCAISQSTPQAYNNPGWIIVHVTWAIDHGVVLGKA